MVGVSATSVDTDTAPLITPSIASPIHQHLFCVRLDFNVDGGPNSVQEVEVEPLSEGKGNPYGSAFRAVTRTFKTEKEARRNVDSGTQPQLAGREPVIEEPDRQSGGLQAPAAVVADSSLWRELACRQARRVRALQPVGDTIHAR